MLRRAATRRATSSCSCCCAVQEWQTGARLKGLLVSSSIQVGWMGLRKIFFLSDLLRINSNLPKHMKFLLCRTSPKLDRTAGAGTSCLTVPLSPVTVATRKLHGERRRICWMEPSEYVSTYVRSSSTVQIHSLCSITKSMCSNNTRSSSKVWHWSFA